jgi:predicted Zn-dependent peptidase
MPDTEKSTTMETIGSSLLEEQYYKVMHKSGVTLLLCPMRGFSTAYALFGTNYGSMDVTFKTPEDEDFVEVPAGIAHYLEHKLFENEDGDAFQRFAATGASANAYTSFDKTCYLFSCTQNFEKSLEILLDFVTRPYFTDETVQKEQGIIGQEIRMYDDNPDWQVYFNLLKALYQKNPVRVDIAGTVESIAEINKELLYRCYNHFYNLHNMVIAIAGNFTVESVLEVADRVLKAAEPFQTKRRLPEEPDEVCQRKIETELEVATPMFQMGFKLKGGDSAENMRNQILDEILVEIIAGENTPIYRELYDKGLINATFGGEAMAVRSLLAVTFGGESREPETVYEAILERVRQLKRDGISEKLFQQCKKATYGRYIGMFSRPEAVASTLLLSHFTGVEMYSLIESLGNVTREQLEQRLKNQYHEEWTSLSIVRNNREN